MLFNLRSLFPWLAVSVWMGGICFSLADADAKAPFADGNRSASMFGPKPHLVLGPMLGHVADAAAKIWVRASGEGSLSVAVSTNASLAGAKLFNGDQLAEETAFAGVVDVTGMEAFQTNYYCVLLNGVPAMSAPYPHFVTARPSGTPGPLRVAFTSCSGYAAPDPAAGMADLALRANADVFLMLGDNHYANSPALDRQRFAYGHQRQSAGFRALTSTVPTYGIWDDHDFGPDNSDGTLENKETAWRAFKEHWANPSYGEPDNPGVYFKFTRGDVDFFMLDGRYHRTPNKTKDEGAKTMLGRAQIEWLKRALLASSARVKFLAAGSEWQSQGTEDGWKSFQRERDEILDFIEANDVQGVILISGDRHFTAAYQVRGRFLEVTSGPIGGNVAGAGRSQEMIFAQDKGRFYSVFDLDTTGEEPKVVLEVYRVGMGLAERRKFEWAEITGEKKIEMPSEPRGR